MCGFAIKSGLLPKIEKILTEEGIAYVTLGALKVLGKADVMEIYRMAK